ncbi:MAG: peptide chain release factor 2 [Chloroflexi bacterium]|nr:peptide chain release factor 2 [Chloroflexota bacterium]
MEELESRLKEMRTRIQNILCVFDIPGKKQEIQALEQRTLENGFWDDPETAQRIMSQLSTLREEVDPWEALPTRVQEALHLLELVTDPKDPLVADIARETDIIEQELAQRESALLLAGEHSRNNAILTVQAGAGGIDAADWAAMLMRMYIRWGENRGYEVEILDMMEGEESGVRNATIEIDGPYAYGKLRAERGVHRLVRLSPFDQAHRRHTSFARVEVMPEIDNDVEVHLDPKDVRMEVFRASGHGGQNVQKNSTAVRLIHVPTGIIASCQNERSQIQNRETAMRILRSRIYEVEREKKDAEVARLRGETLSAEWGNQIRSYVLHPYQMVKDHRTDVETGKTQAVLDGDIDLFIEAWLRSQVGSQAETGR